MHKQQKQPTPHIPLADLIVTDLHSNIPVDVDRRTQMAASFAAGASWAIHPLAVVKTATGYELIDGRLRALVRQAAGETTVPVRVFDLVEDEKAAFRYFGNKNRHTRPAPGVAMSALENSVHPVHEKARRGRPRNPYVEQAVAQFDARSRRASWNKHYAVRAMSALLGAGIVDPTKPSLPLPESVLYVLGVESDPEVLTILAQWAIEKRAAGWSAQLLVRGLRRARAAVAS